MAGPPPDWSRPAWSRHPGGAAAGWTPTRWSLWSLPHRALVYVLVVDAMALAVVAMSPRLYPLGLSDLAGPAWLMLCGGLAVEGSRHVERERERESNAPYKDIYSLWTVLAALVLRPSCAAVFVVMLYTWTWIRVRRNTSQTHRWVFSTATVVLSVAASSAAYRAIVGFEVGAEGMLHDRRAPLAGIAAGTLSICLNVALVAAVILLVEPGTGVRRALGVNAQNGGIEVSAVCLAVLVTCAYAIAPWLVLLTLPVILLLERTLLLSQFQTAARIDSKTGLPNATWWHEMAEAKFAQARHLDAAVSVLICDLDHFKRVNDTYGHLAGDAVLRQVALAFAAEVREHDVVGRFGGEEFVVILPFTGARQAAVVAERLRRRVAALRVEVECTRGSPCTVSSLTVSLGAATFPEHGGGLATLLRAADAALYEAKRAGRNQVRTAALPGPEVSRP